ncbi:hypothetical protein CLJU_c16010 [Clostridium ljungdahlii DSM 13528]|uniref:Uncharacterized protein n=1 Tax=Clostridium ljungdahlii (strain ATCC 55383 / DSM 13528 / PETC) TaxID=748727 RepID=D8GTL6_CLOLD|nr:hypothetical protein CLJU_c16010 [Clostridium ljungdahlii DSM 13528]
MAFIFLLYFLIYVICFVLCRLISAIMHLIKIPGIVDVDAIQPICIPVAPKLFANMGKIGDFDMVELNIAKAPQHPIIRIMRSPFEMFFKIHSS